MLAALVLALSVTVSPVGTERACAAGTLTAVAADGESVTRDWTARQTLSLPLERTRSWTIRTTARGCWAEPLTLREDDARSEATIRIWPSRTLAARLIVPRGEGSPEKVSARIASPPQGAVPETDIACAVAADRAQCDVPAVPLDVRLSADGFAPVYFWSVEQLGDVHLSRGTIVTGRVRPAEADVALRPASLAWSPDAHERVHRQTSRAKTNERGFFQFNNVAPGEYTVVATKKGFSPSEYRVHVSNVATEAVVGRELILGELARIAVSIHPPVDGAQRPWTVVLSRIVTGDAEPVARSEASVAGEWSHEPLEQGVYGIAVLDASGDAVAREGVQAEGGSTHVALTIDQVAIRGAVTLGGDAIEAALRFRDIDGKRIDLQSDAAGRFAGTLPSQGQWDVEVGLGASRITIRDLDVRRGESGYADLELALPGGRIRGKVVDAAGQPHVANVTLFRDRRREASLRTDVDGIFEFAGLEKGAVELSADARAGESGMIRHTIEDEDGDPVRVLIAPRNVVRARVLAPDGRAVAGALVTWVTEYAIRDAVTGPAGDVSIKLPPDLAAITVYVSAPGFPLKIARVAHGEAAEVRLPAIAGTLFIGYDTREWPSLMLRSGTERMNVGALKGMGPPRDDLPLRLTRDGFVLDVEPGSYTVCQGLTDRCETRMVRAGARETIDATRWSE